MATTKKIETEEKDPKLMTEAEAKAYWAERVPITLPYDTGNPEDQTVFVSVNDYTAQILRGKEVMVPRNVAEVLKQSEEAKIEAFMRRARLSKEFEEESAKYDR